MSLSLDHRDDFLQAQMDAVSNSMKIKEFKKVPKGKAAPWKKTK